MKDFTNKKAEKMSNSNNPNFTEEDFQKFKGSEIYINQYCPILLYIPTQFAEDCISKHKDLFDEDNFFLYDVLKNYYMFYSEETKYGAEKIFQALYEDEVPLHVSWSSSNDQDGGAAVLLRSAFIQIRMDFEERPILGISQTSRYSFEICEFELKVMHMFYSLLKELEDTYGPIHEVYPGKAICDEQI